MFENPKGVVEDWKGRWMAVKKAVTAWHISTEYK